LQRKAEEIAAIVAREAAEQQPPIAAASAGGTEAPPKAEAPVAPADTLTRQAEAVFDKARGTCEEHQHFSHFVLNVDPRPS
jgi:hypothetical protein